MSVRRNVASEVQPEELWSALLGRYRPPGEHARTVELLEAAGLTPDDLRQLLADPLRPFMTSEAAPYGSAHAAALMAGEALAYLEACSAALRVERSRWAARLTAETSVNTTADLLGLSQSYTSRLYRRPVDGPSITTLLSDSPPDHQEIR